MSSFFSFIHSNFIIYLFSLFCGIVGAWFIARYALIFGLIDIPNNRSSHDIPKPKGGGIGILLAVVIVSLLIDIPLNFWAPMALFSILGLLGDRFEIYPNHRLFFQLIPAIILVFGIYSFDELGFLKLALLGFMVVFVMGTANLYNFMDGINGIAGVIGIVGFGFLAFYASKSSNIPIAVLAACISLSCLGFLPFNIPKAIVFMGDTGSILLGAAFASIVVVLSNNFLDFICLASFLFLFYVDELTTMFVRLKDKENLFIAHRRHLYQVLGNELNIPHWKISIVYGLAQLIVCVTILLVKPLGNVPAFLLLSVYFSGFVFVTIGLRKRLISNGK